MEFYTSGKTTDNEKHKNEINKELLENVAISR